MIIAHSGVPGSAKTYLSVSRVIDNLKRGRKVYSNIDGFDDENCREMIRNLAGIDDVTLAEKLIFLNEKDLNEVWRFQDPALFVLDELQNYWSNRDWITTGNKMFNKWASVHRHLGQDLIVISQSIEGIDAQVRRMLGWTYDCQKIDFFGNLVTNTFIVYIYPNDNISGKFLDKKTYHFDKRIFSCYRSYVSQDIKELKIVKGTNVLKHPVFYILPLLICGALYMFFFKSSFATGSLFGMTPVKKVVQEVSAQNNSVESSGLSDSDKLSIEKTMKTGLPVSVNPVNDDKLKTAPSLSQNLTPVNTKPLEENKVVPVKFSTQQDGKKILFYEDGVFVGSMTINDVDIVKNDVKNDNTEMKGDVLRYKKFLSESRVKKFNSLDRFRVN
jgi:zona occludens toxin (predicted ATPase)